ncbi:LSM domain-containing protein [Methanobrevibacter sp. DSM 116169]|uniref:LSM domain-containing protein n=1 Tax=Methanobrevibacter sp. DSM 116169 TaxID=3242727 RepID=UPI0038FC00B8
MKNEFKVNEQFLKFKGKNVTVSLRNSDEYSGKLISIDNLLNIVLESEDGLNVFKGGKIAYISML